MEDLETWLERVYQADGDHATLDSLYDQWAQEYDQQIWGSGNPYIAITAGFVGRLIPDYDARILDAGCGTGNMAQIMHQMGYRHIDGLDPSAGMLAVARSKKIYQQLHQLYLDSHIDLPGEGYDAVIAAGVLTHGHAPPESLDGILNLVRNQGLILFSLSQIAFEEFGFKQKIAELDAAGRWRKLDQSNLFRTYPFSVKEAHLHHWILAYQKTDLPG